MKTDLHFWRYLAHFFLEWEMFQTKVIEKIKTHILSTVIFSPRNSCRLWDNVKKYDTARQAIDDNIILRMRFAYWIVKATNTHSEYVILITLHLQQLLHEHSSILRYTDIACLVTKSSLNHVITLDYKSFTGEGKNFLIFHICKRMSHLFKAFTSVSLPKIHTHLSPSHAKNVFQCTIHYSYNVLCVCLSNWPHKNTWHIFTGLVIYFTWIINCWYLIHVYRYVSAK
jgi:hypothetical protein